MASVEQIKATILRVAGNPSSGAIVDLADEWAKEIANLDAPAKEIRITKPAETR
jgi:hypothetical protein